MTKALRTSVFFSAMIIFSVATVNLLTTPRVLWCIFPILGVLWWPMSAYFAHREQPLRYAIGGTALIFGLFFLTYLLFSPNAHPWFLYPLLAVGWWPLSVWGAHAGARRFSTVSSAYVILTVLAVNLLTSPAFWWWVYPAFFVLWWPVSVHLGARAKTMSFAVYSAVIAFLFLVLMHRIQSPHALPWYLFALLPLAWWPVSKALTPRVGHTRFSIISVIAFAAYYTALGSLLYAASNLVSLFALGAAVWLVYALGFSKYREMPGFAALNAILMAGYFILMHRLLTPDAHTWYWYTFFPLLWWVYATVRRSDAFSASSLFYTAIAALVYYGALNRWLSPATPWILFLAGPAAVAVICTSFAARKAYLKLSVWAAAAIILYFTLINLLFTPHTVWAVYPAFAVLWWPLSMWLHTRRQDNETEE